MDNKGKKGFKITSEKEVFSKNENINNNQSNEKTPYFSSKVKKTPITTSIKIYQEDWEFIKGMAMYKSGLNQIGGNGKVYPMDIISEIVDELKKKHSF